MDRLRCLQVFSVVARGGSFVRAAQQLSLSKATVTKHVAWLEESMGVQLLKRTTKQVALTDAGARVLEAAAEMLERYEAMESEVRDSVRLPRGAIRIGTPPAFGTHHLTRVIAQFTARYPDIEVAIVLDDSRADLVGEALDLSIRIAAALPDASYVAQPLMKAPQLLVAAPAYLRTYGAPKKLEDLARHNCLVHTVKSGSGVWRFEGNPPGEVRVRGSIRSNLGDALKQSALLGVGISVHPTYMVAAEIEAGLLQVVLPDCVPEELDINVVFSTRRNMPLRVRHLLDFLKDWARRPQVWTGFETARAAARGAPVPSVPSETGADGARCS
jgi:DNA-binding transcriptional LysR family regulator